MDYKGWVLSIYDEYKSRSDDNKGIKRVEDKVSMKKTLKVMWEKENRFLTISMGLSLMIYATIPILSVFKIINNGGTYCFIPLAIVFLGYLPQWYKYELNLEFYKKEINILKNVLKDNDLYEKDIVWGLYNSTRGIFFDIKTVVIYIISILVPTGIFTKLNSIDMVTLVDFANTVTLKNILIIVMLIVITSVPLLYFIWFFMYSIPNSRVKRSRKFHRILKILIASDKELMKEMKKTNFLIEKYKS